MLWFVLPKFKFRSSQRRTCIQAEAVQVRGNYCSCPGDGKDPNVIFMGILLYSVLNIVNYRAFVYSCKGGMFECFELLWNMIN